jgi:hypothetical protein
MSLSFPRAEPANSQLRRDVARATAARTSKTKSAPFVLEVRIRIGVSANPALYWVQWWTNANAKRHGRVASGLQVVTVILQALRYLSRTAQ